MSIVLQTQDLTTFQPGNSGTIQLQLKNRPYAIGNKYPQIVLNNESGVGLIANFRGSNRQVFLPAGAWTEPLELLNNDTEIDYTAQYVLPSAPVAKLFAIVYAPNEHPLKIAALGNSPIGISGNVQTSNVQSLTNDGQPAETTVIEMTPVDQATSSVLIRNTASGFMQVLSAGLLKQIWNVVRGNASSTKAQIVFGDASDLSITTLHGTADQALATGLQAGAIPAAVTIAGSSVTGDLAANQIGPGALDTDVTMSANQITAGLLIGGVHLTTINSDGGNVQSNGSGAITVAGTGGRFIWAGTRSGSNRAFLSVFPNDAAAKQYSFINNTDDSISLFNLTDNIQIFKFSTAGAMILTASISTDGAKITSDGSGNLTAISFIGALTGNASTASNVAAAGVTAGNLPSGVDNQDGNQLVGSKQTGGAGAGRTIWIGTTDPTTSAAEGDIWIDA